MRKRILLGLALAGLVSSGFAQQGHPLTGTWTGDWGPSPTDRRQVTLVMNWDGKNVTGIINPGPDSIPIGTVFVDVTNWIVRVEADTKDKMHIAAEGKLENLGSYHRTITGIFRIGTTRGDFKVTRD